MPANDEKSFVAVNYVITRNTSSEIFYSDSFEDEERRKTGLGSRATRLGEIWPFW